ncbi:MAG: sensor histidine kinase [Deltaproteobacteria bacterium]|nr:MAG: sensor histidine kinase [Deltaproteobacteria bacterium]
MKLYHQLVVFVLFVTVVPLVVGMAIISAGESRLRQRLVESRRLEVAALSAGMQQWLREQLDRIARSLGMLDLKDLDTRELEGVVRIVYKSSEAVTQVAMLDGDGRPVAGPVFIEHPEKYPEYAFRVPVASEDSKLFLAKLPLDLARRSSHGSMVVGLARLCSKGVAVVPVVVPYRKEGASYLVAVELSLAELQRRVEQVAAARQWVAWVADGNGRYVVHSDESLLLKSAPGDGAVTVEAGGRRVFFRGDSLVALAGIETVGWTVGLVQQSSEALSQIRSNRAAALSLTGVMVLGLLIAGAVFTRRIAGRLTALEKGAAALGRGELTARVPVRGSDEIASLARSFNEMATQLEAARQELEQWNRQLEQKVQERTRELEIAHRRLLETSKLAAIGQLGAGVAHEINNPMVGILGNVQLMMLKNDSMDGPARMELLRKVEAAARRCREIVQNLLRFSEQDVEAEHARINLEKVLRDAYSLTAQQLEQLGIEVLWELEPGLEVMGDHRQLMRVFLNIIMNARTAMKDSGGRLTIRAGRQGDSIRVELIDTGKGMQPEVLDRVFEPFFTTKDVWTNTGLGLSVAYRIIADHGGNIEAESEPDKGSRFIVTLPVIREGERA